MRAARAMALKPRLQNSRLQAVSAHFWSGCDPVEPVDDAESDVEPFTSNVDAVAKLGEGRLGSSPSSWTPGRARSPTLDADNAVTWDSRSCWVGEGGV